MDVYIPGLLDSDRCYKLYFHAQFIALLATITVEIGDGVSWVTLGTTTTTGNKVMGIDAATFAALAAIPADPDYIRFSTNLGYSISNISIKYDSDCLYTLCSECFDYQETHDCPGQVTLVLTWTNDNDFLLDNGQSWNYQTLPFVQELMVFGKMEAQDFPYPGEIIYKQSAGDKQLYYADAEEVMELMIQDVPPYLHKAIALGLVHDVVTVDGERITKEPGSYSPDIALAHPQAQQAQA